MRELSKQEKMWAKYPLGAPIEGYPLAPCHFCGGTPRLLPYSSLERPFDPLKFSVACYCGVAHAPRATPAKAVADWNRTAASLPPAPEAWAFCGRNEVQVTLRCMQPGEPSK